MRNKGIDRRNFLRISATTGVSTLLASDSFATSVTNNIQEKASSIPVRTLGKTGIELPILSMGVDRPDSQNVLRVAYQSGIFHFDSAHVYQNGRNEEELGKFFEGKQRDRFCISTKGMFPYPLRDNFEEDIMKKLDISLKRLKLDYVDIYYTHDIRIPEKIKDERILNILKRIKEEGKARFVGFSSHDQNPDIIHAAVDTGIYDVGLISYNFKMKNLKENEEAIERAAKAGMGLIGMKTMAGGTEDAEGKIKINGQACLKWVWQNEYITTVIPGLTNYNHLDECLEAAMSPEITPDEQHYLAVLCNREMLYCQQCKQCIPQCPQNLPIPDIMRAYMYTYGYKHASLSKETLTALTLEQDACSTCGGCKVICPSGFDVAKKIAAIMPVTKMPDEFLA
ncbi:MAG: aldo/keto reductase [Tannerellaceae bacterium]|jgi:predicted aldo/keto reductase-like oxidoreductase|nr:aldo/keto reductase [Tannerellaceae bacterium]